MGSLFPPEVRATTPLTDVTCAVEAAGHILDKLRVFEHGPGIVCCNYAPRGGSEENGSRIAWFSFGNKTVITTVVTLPLILQNLPEPVQIRLLDTEKFREQFLNCESYTQFRGLWVIPMLARVIYSKQFERELFAISSEFSPQGLEVPPQIWHADLIEERRKNLKLTVTAESLERFEVGRVVKLRIGDRSPSVRCYASLREIPIGQLGIYPGSSGLTGRFLEVAVMQGSAWELLGKPKPGTPIFIS